jgi:hypothetical protein
MSLWEALQAWFSGESLEGRQIWAVSTIWLTRAGKILQFLGGLAVILDIIGPERLREIGQDARASFEAARRRLSERKRWELGDVLGMVFIAHFPIVLVVAVLLLALSPDFREFNQESREDAYDIQPGETWVSHILENWMNEAVASVAGWAVLIGLSAALIFYRNYLSSGFLLILYRMTFGPVVALLARDRPAHSLRWIAVGLFAAGFGLDLLSE